MKISVLLPCYNEAVTIEKLIKKLQKTLLNATIYVVDNNSTDDTAKLAKKAGAIVIHEPNQGKGHAVRRIFAEAEGDIFVMMDGDETYDVEAAPKLIKMLKDENLDMILGKRETEEKQAYRASHHFGNWLFSFALRIIFTQKFTDVLSGYRIMSRRFVKSFPVNSKGFEIETEMTVHALQLSLPVKEVSTKYYARPEDSHSKLSTWSDGFKISKMIVKLFQSEKPLIFYGLLASFLSVIAIVLALPIFTTYIQTGLVPRLPTAILCSGIMLLAFIFFITGLILQSITLMRQEQKKLAYLQIPFKS